MTTRRYIDDISEDDIINQLVKRADEEKKLDDEQIEFYNRRIAEIDRELKDPTNKPHVKRNYRGWLQHFKQERESIINKYKVRYE